MKKENVINEANKIFWLFMIGSILGYIFEMIIVLFQKGYFESRQGLIYGPLIPVYGIGIIIYYIVFKGLETRKKWQVFLIGMILGGVTEYLCSFIQEKVFHTISWDYSYLPFNIDGRTSLLHCTYWGIAGILYISFVEPHIQKINELIKTKGYKIVTSIIVVFMIFNINISCMAGTRQMERRHNIPPKNKIEKFIDKHYPDDYMDCIYANKKNR